MSETPRADALPRIRQAGETEYVPIDDCRQLERELAEARKEREQWADECDKNAALLKEAVELGELAMRQRDTLAEVLKLCEKHLEKHGHEKCDEELDETGWWLLCDVRTALAAVKGGNDE